MRADRAHYGVEGTVYQNHVALFHVLFRRGRRTAARPERFPFRDIGISVFGAALFLLSGLWYFRKTERLFADII